LIIIFVFLGCEPTKPSKDMGTIIYEVPKVEGADKPYEMPELDPPSAKDTNTDNAAEDK